METSEIFSIILMGSASLLCLALIFYLNKITRSVTSIEQNVSDLSTQLQPVINSITEMTENLNDVTEDLKQPVSNIVKLVSDIKDRVDVVFEFEEKVRHSLSANIEGIFNGIKTFWHSYKGNGSVQKRKVVY
jgi:uncharacterized protein YoxC